MWVLNDDIIFGMVDVWWFDGRISGLDSNGSKKTFPTTTHNSDSTEAACENGTSLIVHDHGSDDASQINHKVKENEASGLPGLVGKDSPDELFDVPFVGVLGEEKHTLGMPQYLNFRSVFSSVPAMFTIVIRMYCSSWSSPPLTNIIFLSLFINILIFLFGFVTDLGL